MILQLNELTKAYLEPHRKYHTLDHITRMFNTIRDYKLQVTEEQVVAIWYHDVIYNPQSFVNEKMSALVMRNHFKNLESDESVSIIETIIHDTEKHIPTHPQSRLVIDLDLMGLADRFDQYMDTGKLIRMEYAHSSNEQWKQGRRAFIEKFLNRDHIFHTGWGIERFERKAYDNLLRELEGLMNG